MADEIDDAAVVNELHQRLSQEAQQRRYRALMTPPETFDGSHCIHCAESVEAQRLKAGYFICIECATFIEKYKRVP